MKTHEEVLRHYYSEEKIEEINKESARLAEDGKREGNKAWEDIKREMSPEQEEAAQQLADRVWIRIQQDISEREDK